MRNPVDRLTEGLPHGLRVAIDWIVTLGGAIGVVLLKALVVNPYRIPSSSMEPTLHCAHRRRLRGERSDRVLANRLIYHLRDPSAATSSSSRRPAAQRLCGAGGTFVKRIVGLPGEAVSERNGRLFIDGKLLTRVGDQLLGRIGVAGIGHVQAEQPGEHLGRRVVGRQVRLDDTVPQVAGELAAGHGAQLARSIATAMALRCSRFGTFAVLMAMYRTYGSSSLVRRSANRSSLKILARLLGSTGSPWVSACLSSPASWINRWSMTVVSSPNFTTIRSGCAGR